MGTTGHLCLFTRETVFQTKFLNPSATRFIRRGKERYMSTLAEFFSPSQESRQPAAPNAIHELPIALD